MEVRRRIFYGWVIVAISLVIMTAVYGIYFSWPVFYVAILDDFNWSRAETALIYSAASMVYSFSSPISGILFDRIGPRRLFTFAAALLTGDMIHFPARAGLDAIRRGVDELGTPFLYALGNHDWHMPVAEWCEATRDVYYPRFHGLTNGDPACQSVEVGGVRLIALDNSNYQVSNRQVEFLRTEIASGQPCVLCFHIPLWVESLTPAVVDMWKAPIMMGVERGWTPEKMNEWKVAEATGSTRACRELLVSGDSQNVAAIFCGHVHFAHADEYRPGRYQYVTAPGFGGGHRIIDLVSA